ncbi:hypothetical protein [Paenibacillus pinisoli]|uniref:hypothetical protein n=1 Tax=Paenibacillus pinisoli TaxID=1276110 RepID=UPI001059170E|nr:hypothetical protein [Paenibacillus pinisoli]
MYFTIIISFLACFIIIIFEWLTHLKIKSNIFKCFRRGISKRMQKKLLSDMELLFTELSQLPPDVFRKLKLNVKYNNEDSFTSKMINSMLSFIAIILAGIALFNSWMEPSVLKSSDLYIESIVETLIIISMMFIAFIFHLKFEESSKLFRNKFVVVIDEVEREQPVTVHLSEAQYHVLLASSGRRLY